jgi:hypothetical protein
MKPTDQPIDHLNVQIRYLKDSCESFDKGFEGEAMRLAVSARVLVHDTTKSNSVLQQLGLKSIPFLSSAQPYNPNNLLPHHGLLQLSLGPNVSYHAPLGNRPPNIFRWIPFDEWWTETVFDDLHGNQLSRKDIVLELANKEGGAHVDPEINAKV